MSATVLGALQNAQYNFEMVATAGRQHPIFLLALQQLKNAVTALEQGQAPDAILQEHLFDPVNIETEHDD